MTDRHFLRDKLDPTTGKRASVLIPKCGCGQRNGEDGGLCRACGCAIPTPGEPGVSPGTERDGVLTTEQAKAIMLTQPIYHG